MSRSEFKIRYSSVEKAENTIERILMSNNFMETNYFGESVWKRYNDSMGMTAVQYLKIEFDNEYINLSAWISDERGSSESNLNGIMGMIPKKKLKKVIEEIENNI